MENLKNTAIIVELKQWTEADIVEGKDGIVQAFTGHALKVASLHIRHGRMLQQ